MSRIAILGGVADRDLDLGQTERAGWLDTAAARHDRGFCIRVATARRILANASATARERDA